MNIHELRVSSGNTFVEPAISIDEIAVLEARDATVVDSAVMHEWFAI